MELLNYTKQAIKDTAGSISSWLAAIVEATNQVSDTFGLQLGGKGMYANAWHGMDDTGSMSLNIKFFMGMADKWNSKSEVDEPMRAIYRECLPGDESGVLLTAPSPNGLDVFTYFAKGLFSNSLVTDNPSNTQSSGGNVNLWYIDFGYFDGKNTKPVYSTTGFVIKTASITFGKTFQKIGEGYYPIEGTLSLSFMAQSLLTQSTWDSAKQVSTNVENIYKPQRKG